MLEKIETMPFETPDIKEEVQELYQLDEFYYDHLKKLGLDGQGDVLFKETDLIDYKDTDDGSEFIDIRK
jgi:hypothetical protein